MIDPSQLTVDHRVGSPPPTAEGVGTFVMKDGNSAVVTWGRGRILLCWWVRQPTRQACLAFDRVHGFAPLPSQRPRHRGERRSAQSAGSLFEGRST